MENLDATFADPKLAKENLSVEEHNEKKLAEMRSFVMEPPTKVLFHLAPERFDDETFEQYKERRAENNAYIKKYLKQGTNLKKRY